MKVWLISLLIYLGASLLAFVGSVVVVSKTHCFYGDDREAILLYIDSRRPYLLGGAAILALSVITDWDVPGLAAYVALTVGSILLSQELIQLLKILRTVTGPQRPRLLVTVAAYILGATALLLNLMLHL